MRPKLFSKNCQWCNRSYYCEDENRIFCTKLCESKDLYRKKHPVKQIRHELKELKEYEEPKKQKTYAEKWLERKETEKPNRDLKNIMYRDTFKKYVPKSIKVMRG